MLILYQWKGVILCESVSSNSECCALSQDSQCVINNSVNIFNGLSWWRAFVSLPALLSFHKHSFRVFCIQTNPLFKESHGWYLTWALVDYSVRPPLINLVLLQTLDPCMLQPLSSKHRPFKRKQRTEMFRDIGILVVIGIQELWRERILLW